MIVDSQPQKEINAGSKLKEKLEVTVKAIWEKRGIYPYLLPAFIYLLIFTYIPLINGFKISLHDYAFFGESQFVGLKHYASILGDSLFWEAFRNTLTFTTGNLLFGITSQVLIAILLNEVLQTRFKKISQTIVYTPHLFSWVAVGGIWISLLAPDRGLVNNLIEIFGYERIHFMTSSVWIQPIFVFLNTWKTMGYGCVIILAALTSIDPHLYEAAYIDGANRLRQVFSITIPSIMSTVKVVFMLNLIANLRMFTQSNVLSNPAVLDKTEVVMTYTFKRGLRDLRLDYSSAIAVIMILITLTLIGILEFVVKRKRGGDIDE
ncbi:ABC transporter permease subunit [Wukongibacter baidiensis]|uniref:ABC transporter permease subunit n=1 Tax=Wukongibacter baidiensis TaxID=1723361 RepID=UPI003D7F919F